MRQIVSAIAERIHRVVEVAEKVAENVVASELFGVHFKLPDSVAWDRSDVEVRISNSQFQDVTRDDYHFNRHGVTIALSRAVVARLLASKDPLQVTVPFVGDQDKTNTIIAIKGPNGKTFALPKVLHENGTSLIGSLNPEILAKLAEGYTGTAPFEIRAFTANRPVIPIATQLVTSLQQLRNGQFSEGAIDDLVGKRVVVIVHGIFVHLPAITALANAIAGVKGADGRLKYDVVLGFEYTSNSPLAAIGAALADAVGPLIQNAAVVDVIAHSMGNLVARYAIETPGLNNRLGAKVRYFLGLAGPHSGLPFGDLHLLQTLALSLPIDIMYCIADMLTDGPDGAPHTDFLKNLNATRDPGSVYNAKYLSIVANHYQTYQPGIFAILIHDLYDLSAASAPAYTVEDGLVAVYSANSSVLQVKDPTWVPGPVYPNCHSDFEDNAVLISDVTNVVARWP